MYTATFIFFVILVIEAVCLVYTKFVKKQEAKPYAIDIGYVKKAVTLRKAVLSLVMRHYMIHDANLGYRMGTDRKPFRLLKKIPGSKRFREIKVKNFFEIRTDNQGFICNKIGQQRDYKKIANDDTIYKILVVGNSVTAGYGVKSGEYSWPALLEKKLNQNNEFLEGNYKSIVVINSAALGYQISQEFKKFVDDDIYLNPNLVIAFSGGLIEYDFNGSPKDIALHEEQKKMQYRCNHPWLVRQKLFLQNTVGFIKQRCYVKKENITGEVKISASDLMSQRIKQFAGVCWANNINFIFCLQPGMGVGKKDLTTEEKGYINNFNRYFFNQEWDEYLRICKNYINDLNKKMTQESSFYSLVDIFQGIKETTYCDPRHQNELGHQLICDKIFDIIKSKKFKTK